MTPEGVSMITNQPSFSATTRPSRRSAHHCASGNGSVESVVIMPIARLIPSRVGAITLDWR